MTLRDKLMGIDAEKMADVFAHTVTQQFSAAPATATELVIQRDYPVLHNTVVATRLYVEEEVGLSEREAHLVAGGMVLALALLKDYAEREFVGPLDLPDFPEEIG